MNDANAKQSERRNNNNDILDDIVLIEEKLFEEGNERWFRER